MAIRSEMESVLERWESSGLSLRGFGIREGISYSKLVYWKRKLRGRARVGSNHEIMETSKMADLVAVDVVDEVIPAAPSSTAFAVWLGNGIGIDVPSGFDDAELQRLVSLLAAC